MTDIDRDYNEYEHISDNYSDVKYYSSDCYTSRHAVISDRYCYLDQANLINDKEINENKGSKQLYNYVSPDVVVRIDTPDSLWDGLLN